MSEKTKLSATGLRAGGRASGDLGMYKPASILTSRKKFKIRSL
jgi:hypothetical protein